MPYFKNLGKKLNDPTIHTKSYQILKSFYSKKNPPLLINDKFETYIKTKGNIFNKLFAEQCISLKNDSFLPTSQNILKQSRLHSID